MSSVRHSRRAVLRAGALGAVGLTAAAIPTAASGSVRGVPDPAKYRPLVITDPAQLPHAPADANYVTWHWPTGTLLNAVLPSLAVNDILVLPEDDHPYEVDSAQGFVVSSSQWHSMVRVPCRGIVGLGPNAVIRPSASDYSAPPQQGTEGIQEKVIECVVNQPYFGNFTMLGRDFGGIGYNALWASGDDATWERIRFRGAHRGWLAVPPGEAGAIAGYEGARQRVWNCEVDCRDPASGASVGTSPLMFNAQPDVRIADVWAHHQVAGMPTWWRVTDAVITRLVSEDGATKSPGVNIEACTGHFQLIDSTFHTQSGAHVNIGANTTSVVVDVARPTFSGGFAPGTFCVQIYATDAQRDEDIHVVDAAGEPIPTTIAH